MLFINCIFIYMSLSDYGFILWSMQIANAELLINKWLTNHEILMK